MEQTYSVDRRVLQHPQAGDAIQRINDSSKNLVQHYIGLAKLYLQEGTSAYGKQIALGFGGVILLGLGWILFIATTVAAVSPEPVPYWASIGFWTLLHAGLGAYFVYRTVRAFKGEEHEIKVTEPDTIRSSDVDNELRVRGMVP